MTKIDGQDLSSFSMMDLFRSEVEVHAATLNDSLLALESGSGSADDIESLMRAAHSIKGGARIVDLDVVVRLAHTMEDCFVALQKGDGALRSGLTSEHIDILLRGVDMMIQISEVSSEEMSAWLSDNQEDIDRLVKAILIFKELPQDAGLPKERPVRKKPDPVPAEPPEPLPAERPVTKKPEPIPAPEARPEPEPESRPAEIPVTKKSEDKEPAPERKPRPAERSFSDRRPHTTDKDRMVRVTATKIERLMGLAGEVVVSARWLPPFSKSLLKLKKDHIRLSAILEKIQELSDREEFGMHNGAFEKKRLNSSDSDFRAPVSDFQKLVGDARKKVKECNHYLVDRLNKLDMFTSSSENLSDRLYHEVIRVRMRPFSDGIRALPRIVRDLARELDKKVQLKIVGESTEVDRDILEKLDTPLNHLLRNALDHGIESVEERLAAGKPEKAAITLEAAHRSGILMITVSDDGRGADLDELRQKILEKGLANAEMIDRLTEPELMDFLFLPGFSTLETVSEISGRGVGLDVVHSMVHEVGGVVRATSKPGKGLAFNMELPLTLSVIRTFLVDISGEPYAFPLARIDRCLVLSREDIETVEDREYFKLDNKNVSLVDIHDVLEVGKIISRQDELMVVVISDRLHAYGLVVDKFLGECDLVVRPLDPRLGKVPDISSVAVMLDGSPVLIFDVEDMVRSIDSLLTGKHRLQKVRQLSEEEEKARKHILVVDDSITVREMERKLLESKGYQVDVAVDGMDAWNLLRIAPYDMVVSDIDMPRMNGFELITQIKQHEELKSLPVMIVSYKNKEEDRLRGLEAGANYYLTKSSFQDNSFINAVIDLIGAPLQA
ncbi:hybrid sensor histidine kinase/response regulator [Desulfococcaceae bacterium HSG8]|nr:hybrid sensor histidine kinase/response regulator [Desulfococcaceae bacterium HSG8]